MEGETYKERRNIKREQTMEGRVVKWNGETTTWKEGNMKRGTNKGRKGGPTWSAEKGATRRTDRQSQEGREDQNGTGRNQMEGGTSGLWKNQMEEGVDQN